MDCRTVSEQIGCYLDGESSEGQVAELESHVRACPACAGELDEHLVTAMDGVEDADRDADPSCARGLELLEMVQRAHQDEKVITAGSPTESS